jgi:uncharacterized protein (TIGR00299 family) protein
MEYMIKMTVIIDPRGSGIAGNMIVGAFLDMGANKDELIDIMQYYASHFGDININIEKVKRSGISATFANIQCKDKKPVKYTELIKKFDQIEHPKMTPEIKESVKKVFMTLAEAEAHVHGTTLEKVHFHEVGAADAVADITGAIYAFHELKLHKQKVYCLPVALGGGSVKTMHGMLTVPAPATVEILKNVPTFGGPVAKELTTPTGAALLVNMVDEFCEFYPATTIKITGYGAGKLDLGSPNVLRAMIAETTVNSDSVSLLETNLDTVTGEVMGHLFSRLQDEGALDVSMIPIIMKKNRPGQLLRVISRPKDCDALVEVIMRETGTLGIRVIDYAHRDIAEREIIPVEVNIDGYKYQVRIKVGKIGNEIIKSSPEYEDVSKISDETGVPIKDVMKVAEEAFNFQMKS